MPTSAFAASCFGNRFKQPIHKRDSGRSTLKVIPFTSVSTEIEMAVILDGVNVAVSADPLGMVAGDGTIGDQEFFPTCG